MAESLSFTTVSTLKTIKSGSPHQGTKKIITVVLIHGWGLNSGVWQPLINSFLANNCDNATNEYRLITIDLPGFGNNSNLDVRPYSLANLCQKIDQTIDEPAIYLGWSLGGLIATEMALSYPEKVLGLITVASSPNFTEVIDDESSDNETSNNETSNNESSENIDWPGIKASVLAGFHQQLSSNIEKTLTNFLKIQAMGSPHIRQDLKLITQLVMQYSMPTQNTLEHSLQLLSTSDLRHQLALIHKPFLRLYGENDSLVPRKVMNLVKSIAPNSDQHSFSGASHAPFISHPDDFYQVLSNWIAKHYIVE